MNAKTCCCGHMDWEHMGGVGHCRVCGPFSCARVHDVGEGHRFPLPLTVLLVLLLMALVWRATHPKQERGDGVWAQPTYNRDLHDEDVGAWNRYKDCRRFEMTAKADFSCVRPW